jgi:hypothetical protein
MSTERPAGSVAVRAAGPTRHVHRATFQVCTANLSGDTDPSPANNGRPVTIRIAGRR